MKNIIRAIIVCASFSVLSACMAPVKVGPDTGYVINSVPDHVVTTRQRGITLLTATPDTNPVYNTRRMAYTTRPYQITYYSQSRWVQAPAEMIEPLLVQTLQKTNHFKAIVSPPYTGQYDYVMRTEIKTLLIDYTQKTPVLRLSVQGQLTSAASGRMLSSRDFTTAVPLPQASPYGAVLAANCAADELLRQIAAWSVKNTR